MTTTQPQNRELDAAIAKALGREVRYISSEPMEIDYDKAHPFGFKTNFGGAVYTNEGEWLVDDWLDVAENMPVKDYSANIRYAFELQAEIERRGMSTKYVNQLVLTTKAYGAARFSCAGRSMWHTTDDEIFALINATAEQRARAALKVLEAND